MGGWAGRVLRCSTSVAMGMGAAGATGATGDFVHQQSMRMRVISQGDECQGQVSQVE